MATGRDEPTNAATDGAKRRLDVATFAASRRQTRHHRIKSYSRSVSLMKFFLPALAIFLVALIAIWPQIQAPDTRFKIGFSRLKATESGDPSMVNARFVGTDSKNRPFSVTADFAKNKARDKNTVELEKPKADITIGDGTWLVMTADTGFFDRAGQTLDLVGAVNLFHDSGYEFRTQKALIDLARGIASGDAPIEGQGPFGSLRAEGFRMVEQGKTIFFTGKAKLVIYPSAAKAEK